ncbi:unnamed protein product [Effrenium voratum]|nr:unnamed protein product [Effrenium voratum]
MLDHLTQTRGLGCDLAGSFRLAALTPWLLGTPGSPYHLTRAVLDDIGTDPTAMLKVRNTFLELEEEAFCGRPRAASAPPAVRAAHGKDHENASASASTADEVCSVCTTSSEELLPDSAEAPSASAHAAAHVAAPMPLIQPRFNVYEGFRLVALAACSALSGYGMAELHQSRFGFQVVLKLPCHLKHLKDVALGMAKQSVLKAAQRSSGTYVVGYCHEPFMKMPLGFSALLCLAEPNGACWDLLRWGSCDFGDSCRWAHPTLRATLNVMTVEAGYETGESGQGALRCQRQNLVALSNEEGTSTKVDRRRPELSGGFGDACERSSSVKVNLSFPRGIAMDRGSALRRAGSVLTDSSSRERDRKDLAGSLQSEGVMQLQLALRVELERQTRQLEEILAKQAQSAMDKNAEHRQEVQGIAAAWQLVARTLGEQLQNVQKKGQESARRVEAALEKTLQESVEREAQRHQEVQSVSEAWQTLGRSIGDQLGSLQRLGGKLETGLQRLDSKIEEQPGSLCLERHETENLPGQPSDEEDFALEDLEGEKARVSPSRTMRFNRSQTEDNEQSFAEMQKEFGVRDKNLRAGTMVPADQKVFWLRRCCIQIVAHKRFEMLCSALVILCAATIGIEADYTIQHALDSQHPVFRGLDMAFNFLFALELFVRWVSEGFCPFLSCENPQFRWNWMDLGLVSSSVVEELGALLAAASFLEVSALRMLRMRPRRELTELRGGPLG